MSYIERFEHGQCCEKCRVALGCLNVDCECHGGGGSETTECSVQLGTPPPKIGISKLWDRFNDWWSDEVCGDECGVNKFEVKKYLDQELLTLISELREGMPKETIIDSDERGHWLKDKDGNILIDGRALGDKPADDWGIICFLLDNIRQFTSILNHKEEEIKKGE